MWAGYRQMKKAGLPEGAEIVKWFYLIIAMSVVLMIVVVSC